MKLLESSKDCDLEYNQFTPVLIASDESSTKGRRKVARVVGPEQIQQGHSEAIRDLKQRASVRATTLSPPRKYESAVKSAEENKEDLAKIRDLRQRARIRASTLSPPTKHWTSRHLAFPVDSSIRRPLPATDEPPFTFEIGYDLSVYSRRHHASLSRIFETCESEYECSQGGRNLSEEKMPSLLPAPSPRVERRSRRCCGLCTKWRWENLATLQSSHTLKFPGTTPRLDFVITISCRGDCGLIAAVEAIAHGATPSVLLPLAERSDLRLGVSVVDGRSLCTLFGHEHGAVCVLHVDLNRAKRFLLNNGSTHSFTEPPPRVKLPADAYRIRMLVDGRHQPVTFDQRKNHVGATAIPRKRTSVPDFWGKRRTPEILDTIPHIESRFLTIAREWSAVQHAALRGSTSDFHLTDD